MPALATSPCQDQITLAEPPPFESDVAEVEWVITETLDAEARQGERYRSCQAKHQKVVEALMDCANR